MSSPSPDSRPPSPDRSSEGEVLVKVEGVSKIFCRDFKKSLKYGLKDSARDLLSWGRRLEDGRSVMEDGSLSPISHIESPVGKADSSHSKLARRALRPGEFLAVDNVSFELRRGECLGLIGRNGAGKTTLLKMLNGLIKPDTGTIEMHGRIGALIALGAGFNPLLTGRENIYINGSVIGLTREEIESKIEEIIDFAEIRDFIDSPVQTYSSGMSVRLGFSIASSLQPDVLILDEVLAVGDIGFVIKCLNRVRALSAHSAVIFVSHTMQFISSFCTRVIVMENGSPMLDAAHPQDGINYYFGLMKAEGSVSGIGGASVASIRLHSDHGPLPAASSVRCGERLTARIVVNMEPSIQSARLGLYIDDESRAQVIGFTLSDPNGKPLELKPGTNTVDVALGVIDLNPGTYSFLITVSDPSSKQTLLRHSGLEPFAVNDTNVTWAKIVRPTTAEIINVEC